MLLRTFKTLLLALTVTRPKTGNPGMSQLTVAQAKESTQICLSAHLQRRLLFAPRGVDCLCK